MTINSYIKFFFVIVVIALTACENSVDFGEQYKKTLYIINSNSILHKKEHYFDVTDDYINISVYCAGSESTSDDVTVKLGLNLHLLDSINHINNLSNPLYVNKVLLPESNYIFENTSVTIKAGEEYGFLKLPFNFDGLNPDSCYVLPVTIQSNSKNYDVNPKLNTIIYEIEMVNGFSGEYAGSSTELPKTSRSVQPTLKAMSANVIRMPIHTFNDDGNDMETNFMLLTIASDSVNVSISPWKNAKVTDLGSSTYNSEKMRFQLHYSYINNNGNEVRVVQKITNLKYEKDEDEMDEDEVDVKIPYLVVSPESLKKLSAKGGDLVFTLVTDNAEWGYSISDNLDWLIEKEKTAATLTLMAVENLGDERSATITFNLVSDPTVKKIVEITQAEKIAPAGIQIFKDNSLNCSTSVEGVHPGTNPVTATIDGSEITISGNLTNYAPFPNQTMTLTFVPDSPESTSGKITFESQTVGVDTGGYTYYYYPTGDLGSYDAITGEIRFSIWIYYGSEDNPTYWYEDELLIEVV